MQLSGGSTYIISLPKNWIEELKIKVGENVTIVKNSNRSLTLYPRERNEVKEKTVAVIITSQQDSAETTRRKIIAAYLAGYKTIRIKTKGMRIPVEQTRSIRNLVRSTMIGTEIVESSSDVMSIQILTRLPELSFDIALKRMHLMANNMVKEVMEALEDVDLAHAEDIINMDDEVDRFGLYMRRNLIWAVGNENILQEIGLEKPSECLGYRTVISRIERIADHAVMIAKRIKFVDEKIEQKILVKIKDISQKSLEVFEKSVAAVQAHDFEKGEKVAEMVSSIIEEEKQIMNKVKETEKNETVIRFILEDIRRIAEYSSDIAEVAIDGNIQNVISKEK